MKQRITYLLPGGNRIDPASIHVTDDSVTFDRVTEAALEWRVTLGWNELPVEIPEVLQDTHELHLRWSSLGGFETHSPFNSRLPGGLHAFFTPQKAKQNPPLCEGIKRLLESPLKKCYSVNESFSQPPILSGRFASTASFQFFEWKSGGHEIAAGLLEKVCRDRSYAGSECQIIPHDLRRATYVDADFDAISHTVVLTVYWPPDQYDWYPRTTQRLQKEIRRSKTEDRVEVGVLHPEPATEAEHLSLGGYLTVVGEDDHPGMTLFSFPARHHASNNTYRAQFQTSYGEPTGLHPKLDITFPRRSLTPPKDNCALHAYWTLPSALFIDRYQLSDSLFLASQNLIKLHSLSGETDLEAPDWVIKRWGSAALLQLATPPLTKSPTSKNEKWTVTIPTHLRYLSYGHRAWSSSHANLDVPIPIVFWACEAEEGLKMATNPFDRVNLGYDGLFGPKTMFYHLRNDGLTAETLQVPVLDARKAGYVPMGTLVVVVLGLMWVVWQLVRAFQVGEKKDVTRKEKAS